MTATPRFYRVRVHDGTSALADFEDPATATGNVLAISSVPTDDAPYLAGDQAEVVHGDGLGVDLLKGSMEVGEYHVSVIDVETGGHAGEPRVTGDDFEDGDVSNWTGAGSIGTDADGAYMQQTFLGPGEGFITRTFTTADGIVADQLYRVRVRTKKSVTFGSATVGFQVVGATTEEAIHTAANGVYAYTEAIVAADASGNLEVKLGAWDMSGTFTAVLTWSDVEIYATVAGTPAGRILTRELADAGGAWALLSRRAALEWSEDALTAETPTWATLTLGYLNRLTLSGGLVWDLTIGDTRRAELRQELFRTAPAPALTDASALVTGGGDVLTSPVHLVGGPLYGGAAWGTPERNVFAGVEDFGPVRLEVVDLTGAGARVLCLQGGSGLGGYLAPYYAALYTEALADEAAATLLYARGFFTPDRETWASDADQDVTTYGYFPSLVAQLTDVSTGDVVYTVPIAAPTRRAGSYPLNGGRADPNDPVGAYDALLEKSARMLRVDWDTAVLGAKPAAGTEFDVRVYPATVSATWPLHEKGHPVDLVVNWWEARGIRYDADAAATIRSGIDTVYGGAVEVELTWDQATKLGAYAPQLLSYFGAGVRCDAAGRLQMYGVRHSVTDSGETVTLADLRETDVETFDLDEAQIATRADTKTRAYLFTRATEALKSADDIPPNNLRAAWQTVEGAADPTAADDDERTHVWEIPGRVLIDGVAQDPVRLAQPAGDWLVAWRKRGAPELDLKVLPSVTARAGDLLTLDLPHLPVAVAGSAPVTQRGQATQAVIVLRRTEVVAGADLRVVYAPPADQVALAAPATGSGTDDAVATVQPAFTLAQATGATAVVATLTNATDLAEAHQLVTFAWGVGTAAPADLGHVLAPIDPADDADVTIPVSTGTVWVRARSGAGAWTAWASVAVGGLATQDDLDAVEDAAIAADADLDARLDALEAAGGFDDQAANAVFAGPASGADAAPAFRTLVAADVPALDAAKIASGVLNIARLATGTPDGTKFVRDDGVLAVPAGGGGAANIYTASRTVPSAVGDYVDVGSFSINRGVYLVGIAWGQPNSVVGKSYLFTVTYNETGGNWTNVTALQSALNNAADVQLEVQVGTSATAFRIRRTVAGLVGTIDVGVTVIYLGGATAPTFTASTATGTSGTVTAYNGSKLAPALLNASGTRSASTFLRGDDTWGAPSIPTRQQLARTMPAGVDSTVELGSINTWGVAARVTVLTNLSGNASMEAFEFVTSWNVTGGAWQLVPSSRQSFEGGNTDVVALEVSGTGSAVGLRLRNRVSSGYSMEVVVEYQTASAATFTASTTTGTSAATATLPGGRLPDLALGVSAWVALTDGATIAWDTAGKREAKASVTLAGNRTLSITNAVNGSAGILRVTQDGTGSRTLTLPAGSKIVGGGGTTPTLSTVAGAVDFLAFEYDGSTYWWTVGKGAA